MDPPASAFQVPGRPVRSTRSRLGREAATSTWVNSISTAHRSEDIRTTTNTTSTEQTLMLNSVDDMDLVDPALPNVLLHGHGATMDAELSRDIPCHVFGTSPECDVFIPHAHWRRIPGDQQRVEGPWFKIHMVHGRGPALQVYIEDVSTTGVFVQGKRLVKGEQRPLNWAEMIQGCMVEGHELFQYSFMLSQGPLAATADIRGDYSNYTLESHPFAAGMYSEVFRAYPSHDSTQELACKVIRRRNRDHPLEEDESIAFEVDILKSILHENVVRFVDVSQDGLKTFIFTELLRGRTLYEHYHHFTVKNYMCEKEARHIFRQVCEAVRYLHGLNIVHRDIKSENVMISDCEEQRVKLIDFGLARSSSTGSLLSSICGTHAYMAPEMAMGEERNVYGNAVDIWSLGVMLFRMLTGIYPFDEILGNEQSHELDFIIGKVTVDSEMTTDQMGVEGLETNAKQSWAGNMQYAKDWRKSIDSQSHRSPQVKDLLEGLLTFDPFKRIPIEQVLTHPWMVTLDKDLEQYDHFTSTVQEAPQDSMGLDVWAILTIVPGSIPNVPTTIRIFKDATWLGRSPYADVPLGRAVDNRGISSYQCQIFRTADNVAMVADTSHNGTYINNMKIGSGMAGQLLDRDVLGIMVPKGDPDTTTFSEETYTGFLKYTVAIKDGPDPALMDMTKRVYVPHHTDIPMRGRVRTDPPERTGPVWGRLLPMNSETKEEILTEPETRIGRDKWNEIVVENGIVSRNHCTIFWNGTEAYLKSHSYNGTMVNESTFLGQYQLRDRDRIYLVLARSGKEKGFVVVGYTIYLEPVDRQHHDERRSKRTREKK